MIDWISHSWPALVVGSAFGWFGGSAFGYRLRGLTLYYEENNVKGIGNKVRVAWAQMREGAAELKFDWVKIFLSIALVFVAWLAFDARDQLDEQNERIVTQAECTRDYLREDRIARDARQAAVTPRDAAVNEFQKQIGELVRTVPGIVQGTDIQRFLDQLNRTTTASNDLDEAQKELDTQRRLNAYPPFPERYCGK